MKRPTSLCAGSMRARAFAVSLSWPLAACGSSSSTGPGAPSSTTDAGSGGAGTSDGSAPADGALSADGSADGGAFRKFDTDYSDPKSWLCGPNADHDYCLDPQTATAVEPDGTQKDAPMPPAASTKLDCFYVYPTVAITDPVGNKADFTNVPDILDPLMSQGAPFNQVCTVYAPLYHQITLGSYTDPNAGRYLEVAYADVAAAFRYYLDHLSQGRHFVLMGHSQGTHMIRRLIQREVEPDAAVLARMTLALGIGAVGDIQVPRGATVGGSFTKVPLCTAADETGCMITYNTYGKDYPPVQPNANAATETPCTNPAALGGGLARFAATTFPTKVHQALLDPKADFGSVATTFAVYPDFYTGECKSGPDGVQYLEVAAAPKAGDLRTDPVPWNAALLSPAAPFFLGAHVLDYTFPLGELVDAVRTRAAKL